MNPMKSTIAVLLTAMMLASPIAIAGSISNPHVDDETGEADPRFPAHEAIPGPSIPESVDIDKAKITSDASTVTFEVQVASMFIPHTLGGSPGVLFFPPNKDVFYEVRVDVPDSVISGGNCDGENPQLLVEVAPPNGILWPGDTDDASTDQFEGISRCRSDAGTGIGATVPVFINRVDAKITFELPRNQDWGGPLDYELPTGTEISNPTVRTYEKQSPTPLGPYEYDVASSDAVIET